MAVTVNEYAVFFTASGRLVVVIVGVAPPPAVMVREKVLVTVVMPSLRDTVKEYAPAEPPAGVPDITPVLWLRERSDKRPPPVHTPPPHVPPDIDHVYEPVPPDFKSV